MITVRFPDGTAVTYNNATWLKWEGDTAVLYAEKDDWVATIPAATPCIIEGQAPCVVANPVKGVTPKQCAEYLVEHARELDGRYATKALVKLKRLLAKFNIQTRRWKK